MNRRKFITGVAGVAVAGKAVSEVIEKPPLVEFTPGPLQNNGGFGFAPVKAEGTFIPTADYGLRQAQFFMPEKYGTSITYDAQPNKLLTPDEAAKLWVDSLNEVITRNES